MPIDLPDETTQRLRSAHQELQRAQERWNELSSTVVEMAEIAPQDVEEFELQQGVIVKTEDT